MNEYCEIHENVVQDKLANSRVVKRHLPGDCYCLDCHHSLPAWWNNGKPVACEGYELAAPPADELNGETK